MEIQLDRFIFSTNHTAAVSSTAPPPSLPPPHDHLTARRCGHLFACPPFGLAKTQFCLQRYLPKPVLVKAVVWFRQSGSQDKCAVVSVEAVSAMHTKAFSNEHGTASTSTLNKIYFGDVTTRSRRKQRLGAVLRSSGVLRRLLLWSLLHLFISQKRRVAPVQRSDSTR